MIGKDEQTNIAGRDLEKSQRAKQTKTEDWQVNRPTGKANAMDMGSRAGAVGEGKECAKRVDLIGKEKRAAAN